MSAGAQGLAVADQPQADVSARRGERGRAAAFGNAQAIVLPAGTPTATVRGLGSSSCSSARNVIGAGWSLTPGGPPDQTARRFASVTGRLTVVHVAPSKRTIAPSAPTATAPVFDHAQTARRGAGGIPFGVTPIGHRSARSRPHHTGSPGQADPACSARRRAIHRGHWMPTVPRARCRRYPSAGAGGGRSCRREAPTTTCSPDSATAPSPPRRNGSAACHLQGRSPSIGHPGRGGGSGSPSGSCASSAGQSPSGSWHGLFDRSIPGRRLASVSAQIVPRSQPAMLAIGPLVPGRHGAPGAGLAVQDGPLVTADPEVLGRPAPNRVQRPLRPAPHRRPDLAVTVKNRAALADDPDVVGRGDPDVVEITSVPVASKVAFAPRSDTTVPVAPTAQMRAASVVPLTALRSLRCASALVQRKRTGATGRSNADGGRLAAAGVPEPARSATAVAAAAPRRPPTARTPPA